MTRGLALNVRGLVNPIRQKELTKTLQDYSFACLTEIRRPFRLDNNWFTFCSNCLGRGGAAVCLWKSDFPTAHIVHTAEHAVAVDTGPFRFISLYVPCGKKVQDADYVLEWIPPNHEHVLIAGDWNAIATNEEWHTLLCLKEWENLSPRRFGKHWCSSYPTLAMTPFRSPRFDHQVWSKPSLCQEISNPSAGWPRIPKAG